MSTTLEFIEPTEEPVEPPGPSPDSPAPRPEQRARRWPARTVFAFVVALALVMNCWGLSHNGLGNTYYAAAVRGMTRSWHNFFFVAFDPAGFISVDKPPVALWAQALSARLFGYSSLSLLLPSALAGTASVAVLWATVRRWFGVAAATVAAVVLAVSPINVAVNRLNLPDPYMILFLLLAVWATLRSLDKQHWAGWLVAAGAFLGLAFNSKMLAAAIPVPALALAVAVGSRSGWAQRILRLVVLGAAALAFSVPWMLAVDLTPASARPYVGGSSNDTVQNLVFGYNGLGRVDGNGQGAFGGGRGGGAGRASNGATNNGGAFRGPAQLPNNGRFQPAPGAGPGGRAGGPPGAGAAAGPGGVFGGAPGTLRLFSDAVGGQIAWLLPVAALGAAAALWHHRRSPVLLAGVALFTGWLLLHALVFSYSKGIFHAYYTSALAPGMAALVGIGGVALFELARRHAGWLAMAVGGLMATADLQLVLSRRTSTFHAWARPVMEVLAVAAGVALLVATVSRWRGRLVAAGLTVGLAALTVTPAAWASSETTAPSLNSTLPQAGPRRGAAGATFGSEAAPFQGDDALAAFLRSDRAGETWDLVETSAQAAAALEADEGLSVMALGGFSGSDPAATVGSVAQLVQQGKVRFFLVGGGFARGSVGSVPGGAANGRFGPGGAALPGRGRGLGGGTLPPRAAPAGPGGRGTAAQIMTTVAQVCTPLTSAGTGGALPSRYDDQIYDCAGKGSQLAARS